MSSSSDSDSSSREASPELKRKRESSDDSSDEEIEASFRRRQKKKEQKSTSEESKPKKRKLDKGASDATTKRQNSVWVGNMLFKTTGDDLRNFFDGVGEITRIHMPTKASSKPGAKPENRGFAYVDFATPEAKAAAIARSENPLFGRKLLIKDGGDFSGRPSVPGADLTAGNSLSKSGQKILRVQKQPPAPTLFLGNLAFNTTDDSIRQLFEAHREKKKGAEAEKEPWIRKIRMGTFEDTGHCKGFAFVDFTTIEHATSALVNLKNHHLDGRDLVVEYASADAVRRGAPKGPRPAGDATSKPPIRDPKAKYTKEGRPPRHPRTAPPPKAAKVEIQEPATVEQPRLRVARPAEAPRREKGPRSRPKPGAALAMAKRQSAAILPSTGPSKKITFS
ncbi:hypothetical protein C8J56DRAFT_935691 [Mycena floridula]|nr:hypothetical protein C8J56DRAFT_935691 [Mycena floridula]